MAKLNNMTDRIHVVPFVRFGRRAKRTSSTKLDGTATEMSHRLHKPPLERRSWSSWQEESDINASTRRSRRDVIPLRRWWQEEDFKRWIVVADKGIHACRRCEFEGRESNDCTMMIRTMIGLCYCCWLLLGECRAMVMKREGCASIRQTSRNQTDWFCKYRVNLYTKNKSSRNWPILSGLESCQKQKNFTVRCFLHLQTWRRLSRIGWMMTTKVLEQGDDDDKDN